MPTGRARRAKCDRPRRNPYLTQSEPHPTVPDRVYTAAERYGASNFAIYTDSLLIAVTVEIPGLVTTVRSWLEE
jgi:hypothetical protein